MNTCVCVPLCMCMYMCMMYIHVLVYIWTGKCIYIIYSKSWIIRYGLLFTLDNSKQIFHIYRHNHIDVPYTYALQYRITSSCSTTIVDLVMVAMLLDSDNSLGFRYTLLLLTWNNLMGYMYSTSTRTCTYKKRCTFARHSPSWTLAIIRYTNIIIAYSSSAFSMGVCSKTKMIRFFVWLASKYTLEELKYCWSRATVICC